MTPARKARAAVGRPVSPKTDMDKIVEGGLSLAELESIWGITAEQLKGLSALRIVWRDGLDEAELDKIIEFKENAQKNFYQLLSGTGKSEAVLKELFGKLWGLAMKGKLDLKNWDKLTEKYGLKEYEMNSDSFTALLGGEKGKYFSDAKRVESILEFGQALANLVLTMRLYYPPTGDDKRNTEQVMRYAKVLKQYCNSRNFNMIYLEKWEGMVNQVLAGIKADLDISSLSKGQLLAKIKKGVFGDRLEAIAYSAKDWDKFLVALLRNLENALVEDLDLGNTDRIQYVLSLSKRMSLMAEILEQGSGDKRWAALIQELTAIFKGDKLALDYERVRGGLKT